MKTRTEARRERHEEALRLASELVSELRAAELMGANDTADWQHESLARFAREGAKRAQHALKTLLKRDGGDKR
jgi:hypothetical protein